MTKPSYEELERLCECGYPRRMHGDPLTACCGKYKAASDINEEGKLLHLIQLAVCDPVEAVKGNMPSPAKAVEMIIDKVYQAGIKVADMTMEVAYAKGREEAAYEQVSKYWKRVEAVEAELNTLANTVEVERQRRFLRCPNTSSSHTTSCSTWGDDGRGHTAENFPTPLPCNCGALENFQRARAHVAESELARVRGLLQRIQWSYDDYCPVCDCHRDHGHKAGCELNASLVPSGADSADIGKLDSAHESGLQMWAAVEMFEDDWDEPRPLWEDLPEADRNSYIKMAGAALRVFKVSQMSPKELDATLAGSAETGGGKAAPTIVEEWTQCPTSFHFMERLVQFQDELAGLRKFKQYVHDRLDAAGINKHKERNAINGCRIGSRLDDVLANFPRSPQNQTASSGVEGAHEGTTADESGSREPEKLNNAAELALRKLLWRRHGCSVMALYGDDGELQCAKCHIDFKRMSVEDISARFLKLGFQALAESSLSSPPPKCTCMNETGHRFQMQHEKDCPAASPELLPPGK